MEEYSGFGIGEVIFHSFHGRCIVRSQQNAAYNFGVIGVVREGDGDVVYVRAKDCERIEHENQDNGG